MAELPSGTVTLLFSDLQESTVLLRHLGSARYADLLHAHRSLLTSAVEANGGLEVDTQGDSSLFAFATARDAVAAAVAIQRYHRGYPFPHGKSVRVRIALHAGEPVIVGERYVGLAVHRAARIMGVAQGGQILVSGATADLVSDEMDPDLQVVDLGEHQLKGLDRADASSRSRTSSDTTLGFALPLVSFITCPTKKPSRPCLPPR
jgi:class 3 adenylate cyclase